MTGTEPATTPTPFTKSFPWGPKSRSSGAPGRWKDEVPDSRVDRDTSSLGDPGRSGTTGTCGNGTLDGERETRSAQCPHLFVRNHVTSHVTVDVSLRPDAHVPGPTGVSVEVRDETLHPRPGRVVWRRNGRGDTPEPSVTHSHPFPSSSLQGEGHRRSWFGNWDCRPGRSSAGDSVPVVTRRGDGTSRPRVGTHRRNLDGQR